MLSCFSKVWREENFIHMSEAKVMRTEGDPRYSQNIALIVTSTFVTLNHETFSLNWIWIDEILYSESLSSCFYRYWCRLTHVLMTVKKKHAHISTFILEWGHHHLEKKKRHWFYIMPASEDDSGLIRRLTGKHFFRLGHLKFRELDDEQVVILSAQNVKIRGAHSFSLRGPKLKLSGSRSNTNTYCIVV